MLSVMPFLASICPSMEAASIAQFLLSIAFFSLGTVALLHYQFRPLMPLLLVIFLGCCSVLFLPFYQWYFNPSQPYAAPLGLAFLSLVCFDISLRHLRLPLRILSALIILIAAGQNPTVGLLIGGYVALLEAGRAVQGIRDGQSLTSLIRWRQWLFAAWCAGMAVVWTTLYSQFEKNYPQSSMSNFSVGGGYANLTISASELWKSYNYLIDFLAFGAGGKSLLVRALVEAILISPLILGPIALYLSSRAKDHDLTTCAWRAMALYANCIAVSFFSALSPHVVLVDNLIRGRYFVVGAIGTAIAASALANAIAMALANERVIGHATAAVKLALVPLICGTVALLASSRATLFRTVPLPEIAELSRYVMDDKPSAVVGNYWSLWSVQFYINNEVPRAPAVTPIAIRTEGFGLNVFESVLKSLEREDGFDFSCIIDATAIPYGGSCDEQMAAFLQQGAFPRGYTRLVGRKNYSHFEIYRYRFERRADPQGSNCEPSDAVLRASVNRSQDRLNLSMADAGFVVAGFGREARTVWLSAGEKKIEVPIGRKVEFRLNRRPYVAWRDGCRLFVTNNRTAFLSDKQSLIGVSLTDP